MIGGIDVHLPTIAGDASVEIAVRAVRGRWPYAVFENGLTGERYNDFEEIPFGEIEEIFVYRDRHSANVWDAEGAIPTVQNTMVHIIADEEMITVVVDDRDAAMEEMISEIAAGLRDKVLK